MDNGSRGMGKWLFFVHVMKKDISEGGNVEEVKDVMIFFDIDVKGLILKPLVSEYCDGRKETICPGVKGFGQK
jgi:5S rRNA maturation endonuclease (ribonuclease M5)